MLNRSIIGGLVVGLAAFFFCKFYLSLNSSEYIYIVGLAAIIGSALGAAIRKRP
jgi:hypothetical protein